MDFAKVFHGLFERAETKEQMPGSSVSPIQSSRPVDGLYRGALPAYTSEPIAQWGRPPEIKPNRFSSKTAFTKLIKPLGAVAPPPSKLR